MNEIIGLKASMTGQEVRDQVVKRAERHRARARKLQEQREALMESGILTANTNADIDPRDAFKEKIESEKARAVEMEFLAEHISLDAVYILNWEDLYRIGIVESKY